VTVIALALLAALAFMAGWLANGWRLEAELDAARAEWGEERRAAAEAYAMRLEAARAKEQAWRAAAIETERTINELRIQNNAAARAAADAARQLRDKGNRVTGILNRMPEPAADARLGIARAAAAALGECGSRLEAVAQDADRCEFDRRALIGAWPR
jgi:signal transduction histidine kinase